MSLAASIGSTLGSMLGSFSFGGGTDYGDSAKLMALQNGYWRSNTKWFNENGYKFLRQGLINADYNPILAIGSSPLNGAMPNATASQPTISGEFSSAKQANTAKELSQSQIGLNQANANKAAEEALTEQNKRLAYDADVSLKTAQSEEIWKLLPYKMKESLARLAGIRSQISLNSANANALQRNAAVAEKNADIAEKQYNLHKDTTVSEQKYRDEHPIYNFVDRWSKAISPWAMPVAVGTTAYNNVNNQPNYEYKEVASFDRNGTYKGHTRTTVKKGRR